MDVDLQSAETTSQQNMIITVLDQDGQQTHRPSSEIKLRYMNKESSQLAKVMLQSLGADLGTKQGALVADALLSDVFEFHIDKMPNIYSAVYTDWLHEWIGSLIVANQVRKETARSRHETTIYVMIDFFPFGSNVVRPFFEILSWI